MRFNTHQRALLESYGLDKTANDEAALAHYRTLDAVQKGLVDQLGAAPSADDSGGGDGSTDADATDDADPDAADDDEENDDDDEEPASSSISRHVGRALDLEATRQNTIRALGARMSSRGVDLGGLVDTMVADRSVDVNVAHARIVQAIAGNETTVPAASITVGRSGGQRFAEVADQALLAHEGVQSDYVYAPATAGGFGHELVHDPTAAAAARREAEKERIVGLGLQGLARECLRMRGDRNVDRMAPADLWHAVQRTYGPQGSFGINQTDGDFPLILESAAHKLLLRGYEGAATTYQTIAQEGSVENFQTHRKLRLSEAPLLKKRAEAAPAQFGEFDEVRESYSAEEWALAVGLSRKMMINDDVGAFTDMSISLGGGVADTIENEMWDTLLLTSGVGPVMGDGVVLWHAATHGNLAGSGAVPSQTTIEAGIVGMAGQTGFGQDGGSRPIAVMPRFFVGSMTDTLAANLVLKAQHAATDDTHPAQHEEISTIQPIHAAQLTIRAERDWYLLPEKRLSPMQISYLRGQKRPRLRRIEGTTIAGMMWLIEFDVGVDAVEWRTAWRNPGA